MVKKRKSRMKKRSVPFADYLAAGKGSWIFLLWSVIFIWDGVYKFFNMGNYISQFWIGIFLFFMAIMLCPCYALKTCKFIGIKN